MKRKTLYVIGFLTIFGFFAFAGCGKAVQTSGTVQQEAPTTEEESTTITEETGSEEESTSVPENVETEETASSQPIETEETVTLEETVSIGESEITEMDAVMYATANVNIRKEPSIDAEKIGSLSFGEEVQVTGLDENEQWYRVEYPEVGTGYVSGAYLSSTKPVKQETTQSTPSEAPVETPSEQPSEAPSEAPSEQPSQTTPTTAPNAGAQAVYDQIQQGGLDEDGLPPSNVTSNDDYLYAPQDGPDLEHSQYGEGLHAAQ